MLSLDRHKSLLNFLKEPKPWIDTSESLQKCIASLTGEHTTFSFDSLERLYHSCRMEREVAMESFLLLKVFLDIKSLLLGSLEYVIL